jgi:hypothetical protein
MHTTRKLFCVRRETTRGECTRVLHTRHRSRNGRKIMLPTRRRIRNALANHDFLGKLDIVDLHSELPTAHCHPSCSNPSTFPSL